MAAIGGMAAGIAADVPPKRWCGFLLGSESRLRRWLSHRRGTITAVALRTTRALRTRALLTHAHAFFTTYPETYTGARVVHRGDEV